MQIFDILLVQPITNILLLIYHILLSLHIPSALGFSIVLLTLVIRLILYPVMASQIKSSKKMQELNPHMQKLRDQHKGNPQKLQQETMALYRAHGYNPFSGCLPLVIQLPVIWGLYAVLQHIVHTDSKTLVAINKLAYLPSLKLQHIWDTQFFGLPLGKNPSQLLSHVGFFILIVPLLTGLFQFVQSRMMFAAQPKKEVKKTDKKTASTDFAQAFQSQSMIIFPVMIAYLSFNFPIGLSLYWNTFTIFGIIQQYLMQRGKTVTTLAKK